MAKPRKTSTPKRDERLAAALNCARELLEELETGTSPISSAIMKAKKLARLVRDTDAQDWLTLELKGYPENFHFGKLGSCEKYAREGGRLTGGKYYMQSLPEIEASLSNYESELKQPFGLQNFNPTVSSSNPGELVSVNLSLAVKGLVAEQKKRASNVQSWVVHFKKLFHSLKGSLHAFASEAEINISFGQVAEELFFGARKLVDEFTRKNCPKAAEQLLAAHARFQEGTPESLAQALTSCRRVLLTVADSVFPASDTPYKDSSGKNRTCGAENYNNRLLAFLDTRLSSKGDMALLEGEMGHLSARLDSIYEKASKGVHADITDDEARLGIIHTYLFLAEVARAARKSAQQKISK